MNDEQLARRGEIQKQINESLKSEKLDMKPETAFYIEGSEELRNLPDEELTYWHDFCAYYAMYDKVAQHREVYSPRVVRYGQEMARRETVRQGERMERLTRSLNWLTWVILGATIVGVMLTLSSLYLTFA